MEFSVCNLWNGLPCSDMAVDFQLQRKSFHYFCVAVAKLTMLVDFCRRPKRIGDSVSGAFLR